MLFAFVIYFAPVELIAAYAGAVLVHEVGHYTLLKLFRFEITSFRVTVCGCLIEHCGTSSNTQKLLCAFAGPLSGIIYAYALSYISNNYNVIIPEIFAGFSLALSIYNLLPCRPLDGAMILEVILSCFLNEDMVNKLLVASGLLVCIVLLLCGIYLSAEGGGYGLVAAAVSLLSFILFDEGIVKIRNMR